MFANYVSTYVNSLNVAASIFLCPVFNIAAPYFFDFGICTSYIVLKVILAPINFTNFICLANFGTMFNVSTKWPSFTTLCTIVAEQYRFYPSFRREIISKVCPLWLLGGATWGGVKYPTWG